MVTLVRKFIANEHHISNIQIMSIPVRHVSPLQESIEPMKLHFQPASNKTKHKKGQRFTVSSMRQLKGTFLQDYIGHGCDLGDPF